MKLEFTSHYIKTETGLKRIPLVPLTKIDEFAYLYNQINYFANGKEVKYLIESDTFMSLITELLAMNGLDSEHFSSDDLFNLCVANQSETPILAELNCITEDHLPQPFEEQTLEEIEDNPKIKTPKAYDYFPILGTDGSLCYLGSISISTFDKFCSCYRYLLRNIDSVAKNNIYPSFPSFLIHNKDIRNITIEFLNIAGLDSNKLNIHQVSELVFSIGDYQGLIPLITGLVPTGEDVEPSEPETGDLQWTFIGKLFKAGVSINDAIAITNTASIEQVNDFSSALSDKKPGAKMLSEMTPKERKEAPKLVANMLKNRPLPR